MKLLVSPPPDILRMLATKMHQSKVCCLSAYLFTSEDLLEIFERTKTKTRVLIASNRKNRKYVRRVENPNVQFRFYPSRRPKTYHPKYAIYDGKSCIIMSANLTNAGMRINREIAIFIDNKQVVSELLELFEKDWKKAKPPKRRK